MEDLRGAEPESKSHPYNRGMPDRATVEDRVRAYFDRRLAGVVDLYLFGSVARGDARPGSDVDLAVLFAEDPRGRSRDWGSIWPTRFNRSCACPSRSSC